MTCDKWKARVCAFNSRMQSRTPSDAQRAALQQFEAAYAQWCAASQALAAAEYQLWTETLALADGERLDFLAAEVVRLRNATHEAYEKLLPLLSSLA